LDKAVLYEPEATGCAGEMVDTGRFLVAASHNEVCTTSYTAISVGYGWTSTGKYLSGVHKMLITK
jgi:hypothetical protein